MFWLFGNFVRGYGVDGLEKKGLGGAQVRVVVYGERLVVKVDEADGYAGILAVRDGRRGENIMLFTKFQGRLKKEFRRLSQVLQP